jgi:hypothetical protein
MSAENEAREEAAATRQKRRQRVRIEMARAKIRGDRRTFFRRVAREQDREKIQQAVDWELMCMRLEIWKAGQTWAQRPPSEDGAPRAQLARMARMSNIVARWAR